MLLNDCTLGCISRCCSVLKVANLSDTVFKSEIKLVEGWQPCGILKCTCSSLSQIKTQCLFSFCRIYNVTNVYVLPATVGISYNHVGCNCGKVMVALFEITGRFYFFCLIENVRIVACCFFQRNIIIHFHFIRHA